MNKLIVQTSGIFSMLLILALSGCTKKPPACDDPSVLEAVKDFNAPDAILGRLVESRFTLSDITDEGIKNGRHQCSAATSGSFMLRDDLSTLSNALEKDSSLTVDERLAASTYLFSLEASGLEQKGDTYANEGRLTYTTAYDKDGTPVVNVIMAK